MTKLHPISTKVIPIYAFVNAFAFDPSRHGILHKPSASVKFWPKSFHKSSVIFDIFRITHYA